jgi:hypothetical protein
MNKSVRASTLKHRSSGATDRPNRQQPTSGTKSAMNGLMHLSKQVSIGFSSEHHAVAAGGTLGTTAMVAQASARRAPQNHLARGCCNYFRQNPGTVSMTGGNSCVGNRTRLAGERKGSRRYADSRSRIVSLVRAPTKQRQSGNVTCILVD